jgi:hypothetical protein
MPREEAMTDDRPPAWHYLVIAMTGLAIYIAVAATINAIL